MEEIKKEIIEKVILVAVADQDTTEAEESLDELEKVRLMKSMLCYTELMRQGSSVMTNYHQHRSAI